MRKNTLAAALEPYGIYDGCKFIVEYDQDRYRCACEFKNGTLFTSYDSAALVWRIISGYADVTVLPWKPKIGDRYWVLDCHGAIGTFVWADTFIEHIYFRAGIIARTEAELLSRKDEIMREIGMIE